ncbi:MAG: transmembrane(s)protein [candidate division WS6 bacterium 34_10]|uniref:Transmembrane(S)protein n=1 Tax=candidate division WS6 bacterium 34_10 TaxID=1641389 RepID=A0A101HFW2_9BACT|nr:MAG: transmembrane(s)protein [candidate division WS6 bacterium 34_10]
MKYLLTIITIFLASVIFGYYLLNNPNFLPMTQIGEYNWINIFMLMLVSFLSLFSLLNLLIFLILHIFKKEMSKKERIIKSIKMAFLISIGVFIVFILNFFHILNWMWGISILLVVLIFTFVI